MCVLPILAFSFKQKKDSYRFFLKGDLYVTFNDLWGNQNEKFNFHQNQHKNDVQKLKWPYMTCNELWGHNDLAVGIICLGH